MNYPDKYLDKKSELMSVLEEGEGFEPPEPFGPPAFKAGTFIHSVIPPFNSGTGDRT